jgi:CheY-like chemotaxis protein
VQPLSVIVADDVPEIVDLIASTLKALGHVVRVANNGHEAAKLLLDQECDLLITDVLMPDGDGLELIRASRRTPHAPRILAISGGGSSIAAPDCIRMAKILGADEVLEKPFGIDQLNAAIQQLFRAA